MHLFLALSSFLTHIGDSTLLKYRTLKQSFHNLQVSGFFLSAAFSSLCSVFLDTQLVSTWASLPGTRPQNSLMVASWDQHRAHLVCFLSLRDPIHYLISNVLKIVISYILFIFLVVIYIRVKLFPITPSWPEVEG